MCSVLYVSILHGRYSGFCIILSNSCLVSTFEMYVQVRKYEPFIVVETNGDKLSGSSGFNSVAG